MLDKLDKRSGAAVLCGGVRELEFPIRPPAISFEATVTDTGQVIEVRALSGIPPRLPRGILAKLQDAAMRHSFEPYVLDGKAATFTTTIALEMP